MTEWDGSYGDGLTIEEVLKRKEPLFTQMAREVGTLADIPDLVQEARVATWRSLEAHPDVRDPMTWSTVVGKRKILESATRQHWTGMPSQQGKPSVDPIRRHDRDSIDDENFTAHLAIAAPDLLEGIELAYHSGEILDAINRLEPLFQRYIVLRFWHGMSNAEIAEREGGTTGPRLERQWRERVMPVLRRELAHLAA